jgi:hypothetical protein
MESEELPVDNPHDTIARNYASLHDVLTSALAQAATGKGAERHGSGLPFEEQPMQVISDLLQSNDGMAFQAIKKVREGLAMPDLQACERELLGAINYIAGIVIRNRRVGKFDV